MTDERDLEFEALEDEYLKAWTADVPNIVEIRECRQRVIEHLARCVWELMNGGDDEDAVEATEDPSVMNLRVIVNFRPQTSAPRGICSPVKTDEFREFEESLITAFGQIESCTMAWGDR